MATRSGDRIGARRGGRRRRSANGDVAGAAAGSDGGAPVLTAAGAPEALADQAWRETVWTAGRRPAPWTESTDARHLRPFTSTAQVPRVAGGGWAPADARFAPTGMVPVMAPRARRPRPPLLLRLAVWVTFLALLAGIAGLVVHRVRPQWLRSLEVHHGAPGVAPAAPAATKTTAPAHARQRPAEVAQSAAGLNAATVTVRSASYSVLVTAQGPCWVQASSPAAFAPLFSGVVPAGTAKAFPAANGQLTVQLGASHVVVQVQVAGKTFPGWQFTPAAVPFTLNFAAASG